MEMPVFEMVSLAPSEASLERLKSGIDMTAEAVVGASESLEALKDTNQFVDKKEAAISTVGNLASVVSNLPGMLAEAGSVLKDVTFRILEGYVDNTYPITEEGLGKCDRCAIRCDSLKQPRYLDPYLFAKNVRASSVDLSPETVSVESISRMNPEDMFVTTILTRTYIYLVRLREREEEDWFYGATFALTESSEYLGSMVNDIHDILEAIRAPQFQDLAIATLQNPATEESYLSSIDAMQKSIKQISNTRDLLAGMTSFYQNYVTLLKDTQDSILEAYQKYIESNQITF